MSRLEGVVRSVSAIVVGMVLITLIVEGLEFLLVTLVSGGLVTETDAYFAIRNRPPFLAAKLAYNGAGALLGGWVTARIAGRRPRTHGAFLAAIQTVGFLVGIADPAIRATGPLWMWITLTPLMAAGILLGAVLEGRRRNPARQLGAASTDPRDA